MIYKAKVILNKSDVNLVASNQSPNDLVTDIRYKMLSIKGEAMSDDGSSVDYNKVRDSQSFNEYKVLVQQLKFVDLKSLTADQLQSFLINIYNSLVIHSIIEGLLSDKEATSTVARLGLYASASYCINDMIFSLNDIENGLLRRN